MLRISPTALEGFAAAYIWWKTPEGACATPARVIKALAYFSDGDLDTLSSADRTILINAAQGVGDLPDVVILDPVL
jgi:hypothetical protein